MRVLPGILEGQVFLTGILGRRGLFLSILGEWPFLAGILSRFTGILGGRWVFHWYTGRRRELPQAWH